MKCDTQRNCIFKGRFVFLQFAPIRFIHLWSNKNNATSPGYTATALNNFQGTDSLEVGSREPIRVALETDGPTGGFTGPEGKLPW